VTVVQNGKALIVASIPLFWIAQDSMRL